MSNRIIFQHIPKTAGSSLAPVFLSQFNRKDVFICGSDDGVLKDFLKLSGNEWNRIKLLIGHVDYGIHRCFRADSKYIAFLRHPVERVLSHYYFIRSNKPHRYHDEAKRMDIGAFIKSGIRPRMNNCMVRMISGENPDYNECYDEMVDMAMENLRKDYIFVSLVDHLSESVAALTKLMGWNKVEIKTRNVNEKKPDIKLIPGEFIEIIYQYNSLDIKLYNLMKDNIHLQL